MPDWEGILNRHGPAVWRCAYRLLGRRDDAEECYQETFLSAIQLWERTEVKDERALLLRLTTARAIDLLRSRYRRSARQSATTWESVADTDPLPSQHAEAAELSARLRHALAELPARHAEVFCLYALEGWTYQEIAAHLKVTVDSAGVTLFRARARLRTLLQSSSPDAATSPKR